MSETEPDRLSDEGDQEFDFDEFISHHQRMKDELNEFRRITNIQRLAVLGILFSLLLSVAKISDNETMADMSLPPFMTNIIRTFDSFGAFIETALIPLLGSVPVVAIAVLFLISTGIVVLFGKKRQESDIDRKDIFKANLANAASSLSQGSTEETIRQLYSLATYRSTHNWLSRDKIEQIKDFLDNIGEIENEKEVRKKLAIVLDELIDEISDDEPQGRIVAINQELEERASSLDEERGHLDTFVDGIDEEFLSKQSRFDMVIAGAILGVFFLGHQQLALLLGALFSGMRLGDYFR